MLKLFYVPSFFEHIFISVIIIPIIIPFIITYYWFYSDICDHSRSGSKLRPKLKNDVKALHR